jgi:pyruvate kinase
MLADRRVKIVATVGPSISQKENLRAAIETGVNVIRLNFSHGTHEEHLEVIRLVREISRELVAPVAILQDLQGPKIRVGKFKNGSIELKKNEIVIIDPDLEIGEEGNLPTDFSELPEVVEPGTKILLDDGLLELSVTRKIDRKVEAKVIYGGILKNRKGMNLPGANLPVECLTEKDLEDLEFGLSQKVDYVALSFVRKGDDLRKLRELVESRQPGTRIIAKVEMLEALDNLDEIVALSDGVMVARGDLAVEVGQSQLPGVQKKLIHMCNLAGKPVITATQMLDSMVENPRPTRAEITDIANAVLDGSDALMLSAETASGKHPIKCIQTMHEISTEVEKTGDYFYNISLEDEFTDVAQAIAASACLTAQKLNASAIVCLTTSGKTASMISKFRPKARVIAVTHILETLNRLELVWGVQTLIIRPYKSTDEAMSQIEDLLIKYGLVKHGDKVVLTLGVPVLLRARTNSLRVFAIGQEGELIGDSSLLPLRFRRTT